MPALINPGNDQFSVINFLPHQECAGYSLKVAAKSAAGRGNPSNLTATPDAPCVFFCVFAFVHLLPVQRFLYCCSYRVMVAQAGLTSVRPVSVRAGISTPVWATTHERGNSGGSVTRYLTEVAIMATVPALSHPEFTFVFLAVRRTDRDARPRPVRVIADCEHAARLNKSDGDTEIRNIKICSPLRVTAITSDADGSNYGRLLEWEDTNGNSRKWAMPMEMLGGSGEELRRVLLVNGLSYININGMARAFLMEYISLCKPDRKVTCVNKTGWHGGVYVLQDEVIGREAQSVILQTSSVQGRDFRVSGTSEDWRENIGRYCIKNARLAFAVSLAFAAPLLKLVGIGGGGYHLKGESTDGKTTTMKVAASVCGGTDFWHTWRATGNALEGTASRRNDATLMLDEIREVDGREAGNIAYMLANGQGKARARTDGSVRETNRWNLLFLSTGELSLVEHAASAGERTYAGVEVRMIQIPSDSGKYGVFEELHGFSSGKTLAEHLEQHVAHYHGAPFRDWLHCLTADLPELTSQAKALLKEYTRRLTPENAGNQVGRAVTRFALVAMAGELATKAGITGWPEGEAFRAAQSCLAAWMADRGHTANQEDKAALEQVRDFMTRNQFSRFADWNDDRNRPVSMMGFRKVDKGDNVTEPVVTFYVLPSGWKEICKGFDSRKVARLCVDAGWLKPGEDGRTQNSIRLPEIGLKRVYQFNTQVLGSAEPE